MMFLGLFSGRLFFFVLITFAIWPAAGAVKIWNGNQTFSYWTNPSNWLDRVAPSPGDDLHFTYSATRSDTVNDFPAGTPFNSISISGINYLLAGNLIVLQSGITNSGAYHAYVRTPLRLSGSQAFNVRTSSVTLFLERSMIDLNGFDLTLTGAGHYDIRSSIQGAGSLILDSSGSATLQGTNTYTGWTRVLAGTLRAQYVALGDAIAGIEVAAGATLTLLSEVPYNEPIVLAGEATLNASEPTSVNGPVTLNGPNVHITSRLSFTINGVISGAGGISKDSATTLFLNADNTYTGSNRVVRGTLTVNGRQPASDVFVQQSAVLAGTGQVGRVTCPSGKLSPGVDRSGILTCADIAFGPAGIFAVDMRGSTPGAGYDQLNVEGSVALANAFLTLSNTFAPSPGEQFVIISNDGSDAVSGIFGDVPEGQILASGGVRFRISYAGGDGNDVVLTALPPAPPATGITRVWDGGGANNLWTTPENWVGDIAPGQGDDLQFPDGASQAVNVNDFREGTTFNSLRFTGAGYRLEGARIALNAGISAMHLRGSIEVAIPLELNTNQTFMSSFGPLRITAPIDTAGSTLTVGHEGEVQITGTISGAGSVSKMHSGRLALLAANTYSGVTEVTGGELIVSNALALGTAKYGTAVRNNSLLTIYSDVGAEPLMLDGRLRSMGESEASSNRIGSAMALGPRAELQISNVLVIESAITGVGPLSKLGQGTLVLNGSNAYGNGTWLSNGTLVVNGFLAMSPLNLVQGTLGGTGWVQYVNGRGSNTTVAPALDQPGVLSVSEARLREFGGSATFAVQLNGTRPGIDYDQLRIERFISFGDAPLQISLGFTPAVGDRFVIVDNLTPYTLSGSFYARRQGAVFMVGQTQFQISYRGGDSNDVELTVTEGLALTRTWDGGGGANRLWSNPQNWFGDRAPAPGDTLVFPRHSLLPGQISNTNDFPANTAFRRLIFDGMWVVSGAPLSLDFGILAYDSATVAMPLTLESNLAFICDADIYADDPIVEIRGPVDLAEKELTLRGSGKIRVRNQLHSGDLIKSGAGTVELYSNNLHRATRVLEGELALYHSNALASADFETEVAAGAQLTLPFGNVTVAEPLLLEGTLASLYYIPWMSNRWAANITLQGDGAVMNSSNILLISGTIQGPADLVKAGPGGLMLVADNTYTGATIVSNGTVFVHGSQPQSPVFLRNGTLSGHGLAGHVVATNPSAIQPGNGPFLLVTDIATLSCRDLTVSSNTSLTLTFNGANAGTEYDQLKVAGTLTLNRTRLTAQMRFIPQISQSLVFIDNDGNDPVNGTFGGLAEGAFFVQSNMLFQISYVGGDGNDVTVTRIPAPPSTLASVTLQNNAMLIQGRGISNLVYTIESATNLNPPIAWIPLGGSSANRSNIYQFIDTNSSSHPMRFYRAVSP